MKAHVDTYLLELILMDTIALTGGRCHRGAERVIQRYIPQGHYDRIIERYDELSDDQEDGNPRFLEPWFNLAASKDSRWKRMMILRFLCILRAGGMLGSAELTAVATLAAAMNASRECSQVFCVALRTYRPRLTRRPSLRPLALQTALDPTIRRNSIDTHLFSL